MTTPYPSGSIQIYPAPTAPPSHPDPRPLNRDARTTQATRSIFKDLGNVLSQVIIWVAQITVLGCLLSFGFSSYEPITQKTYIACFAIAAVIVTLSKFPSSSTTNPAARAQRNYRQPGHFPSPLPRMPLGVLEGNHPLGSPNSGSLMHPIKPAGAPAPAFLQRLDGRTVAGSRHQAPSALAAGSHQDTSGRVSAAAASSFDAQPHNLAPSQAAPRFVAGPPAPAPLATETSDGRTLAGSGDPAPSAQSSRASRVMSSAGAPAPSKPLDRRPVRPSTPALNVARGAPGPAPILRPPEDQPTDQTGRRKAGQG